MILNVKQLFECTGYEESFKYHIDADEYLAECVEGIRFPIAIEGVAKNCADVVTIEAQISYSMNVQCDRCLRPFELNQNLTVFHTLVRALSNEDTVSDEFIVVDSDSFDMDDLFAGEIVLALPTKLLCNEDCKGLCPVCGHDLNEGDCGCDRRERDPRLAALYDLLNND